MEQRAVAVSDSGTEQDCWQQREVAGKVIYSVNDEMTSVLVFCFSSFICSYLFYFFFQKHKSEDTLRNVIIPLNLNLNCDFFFLVSAACRAPFVTLVVTQLLGLDFYFSRL